LAVVVGRFVALKRDDLAVSLKEPSPGSTPIDLRAENAVPSCAVLREVSVIVVQKRDVLL